MWYHYRYVLNNKILDGCLTFLNFQVSPKSNCFRNMIIHLEIPASCCNFIKKFFIWKSHMGLMYTKQWKYEYKWLHKKWNNCWCELKDFTFINVSKLLVMSYWSGKSSRDKYTVVKCTHSQPDASSILIPCFFNMHTSLTYDI